MDGLGELACILQVRLAGLAPDQVGVRRIGEAAADRLVQTRTHAIKAFDGTLAGDEGLVVLVDVGSEQVGGVGIGACYQQGRHAGDVGGEARGVQLVHRFARRHQHLAAHVAALLHRGQLVLEMHAGGARLDHRLHQLECVQHATETSLGVGHDRHQPVHVVLALGVMQLVGAQQGVVDTLDHQWHRVRRIQRLVRIHLAGDVGVGRDLPAAEVDRLQAGLDLLHRLIAGEGTERVDEVFLVQRLPQSFGAAACQRMLDGDGAAQTHHILGGVVALDAGPAGVVVPVQGDLFGSGQRGVFHGVAPWNRRWCEARPAGVNRAGRRRAG